jgi:hypothetical protein
VNRCRRRKDRLHLPGKPSEKGGYREFQCAPARRVARRRYLLLGARSPDRHRKLAAALQHNPAARLDRLPRPGPEVFVPALTAWPAAQPRPAPPAMLPLVPKTNPKLTFQSDHLLGAGQALVSFMHRGSSLLSLLRHAPGRECRIEKHRSSTGADRRKCFVMMGRGADAARCIKLKCL